MKREFIKADIDAKIKLISKLDNKVLLIERLKRKYQEQIKELEKKLI